MIIVLFDRMDNDGRGARAVFELPNKNTKESILYIGLDRDMKNSDEVHYMDYLLGELGNFQTLFFLDLAPRTEAEAEDLGAISAWYFDMVIIDHHELNYAPRDFGFKYTYKDGVSACMLTWEYFFENQTPPYAVRLINDRDVWIDAMQPQTNGFSHEEYMIRWGING